MQENEFKESVIGQLANDMKCNTDSFTVSQVLYAASCVIKDALDRGESVKVDSLGTFSPNGFQRDDARVRYLEGITVETFVKDFVSANVLRVEVGTNGFHGGDSGHGCRTLIKLEDLGGTDMSATVIKDEYGYDTGVEIALGGDCELETIIEGLQFAVNTLERQKHQFNGSEA